MGVAAVCAAGLSEHDPRDVVAGVRAGRVHVSIRPRRAERLPLEAVADYRVGAALGPARAMAASARGRTREGERGCECGGARGAPWRDVRQKQLGHPPVGRVPPARGRAVTLCAVLGRTLARAHQTSTATFASLTNRTSTGCGLLSTSASAGEGWGSSFVRAACGLAIESSGSTGIGAVAAGAWVRA